MCCRCLDLLDFIVDFEVLEGLSRNVNRLPPLAFAGCSAPVAKMIGQCRRLTQNDTLPNQSVG